MALGIELAAGLSGHADRRNDIGQLAAIVVIRTVLNYLKDIASAGTPEAAA